jgi:PKD repeat protein
MNNSDAGSSCSTPSYLWTLNFAPSSCASNTSPDHFTNGTNRNSKNPTFIFSNPGIYTITLAVTNGCGTVTSIKTVTVKSPPKVNLAGISNSCGPVTLKPSATVTNCGTGNLTYSWIIDNGTPITTADPGNVTFGTAGQHTISLTVTNECGSTTDTKTFVITPLPELTIPANIEVCPGAAVGPLSFTSTTSGATISWTSSANRTSIGMTQSSGSSTLTRFTAVNNAASPISVTITVTATANGCSKQSAFTITVNPQPLAPATSNISYCKDETAFPLTATGLSGFELLWYTTSTGGTGTATAPTPSTATIGTTTVYVSQTNHATECESPRAALTVTVRPIPTFTATANNPAACGASTGSIFLSGLTAGTTYTVSYTKNGIAATPFNATATTSGTITISGLTAGTYNDVTALLNGCRSSAAGPYTLTDPSAPAAPLPTASSPVCSGGTILLSATSTTAGTSFQWTGPSGNVGNSAAITINNATAAAAGTYTVTVTVNGCSVSATTTVVVNPSPAKPTAPSPVIYCQNEPSLPLAASGANLTWYTRADTTDASTTAPVPATTSAGTQLFYVLQTNSFGCKSDTARIQVIVHPSISGNTIEKDQTLCEGGTPQALTPRFSIGGGNGSYTYQWQSSTNGGTTWTTIGGAVGSIYSPGPLSATTSYRRIVNSRNCRDTSAPITVTIQGTLTNTGISAAQTICSGTRPATLEGQQPSGGSGSYLYSWESSTDGSTWTTIADATSKDYSPPALTASIFYRRKVSSGECSIYSSPVSITVNPTPTMATVADVTVCHNTTTGTISFSAPRQPASVSVG